MARSRLRALGWWVADYNFAVYWQIRGLFNRTDPATLHVGDKAPVVVIPGIYESWRFLLPLVAQIHALGHPIHVVPTLKWNLRPVAEAAALVNDHMEVHDLKGVIIVAHSKGGLLGKQVMVEPHGSHRVHGMLAVATPFGGSVYARFMLAPSLRIFSPKNSTIRALGLEEAVNSRIVSVYGKFDPHIPARSELAGAKNVELNTGGHFRILANPRVLAEFTLMAPAR